MVKEEEDSTPSAGKGEGGNMAQSERRIMPEKCESRSPPSNSGNDDDDDDDDEDESEEGEEGEEGDEGLKPVTTGECPSRRAEGGREIQNGGVLEGADVAGEQSSE